MNILIIQGHPCSDSLVAALAKSYQKGVEASAAEVAFIQLIDLKFDPILRGGYQSSEKQTFETDLVDAQAKIKWADHLVFAYPNWWATMPALLKGFIDRVFLSGFAFAYQEKSPLPLKLLKGKTAHLLVTMDSPPWYYRLFLGRPGHKAMKKGVLEFCGISPVRITVFGEVRKSSAEKRAKWLKLVEGLGQKNK